MQQFQNISIKQSQNLVMNQMMQQSIKLLQMNALEATAFIAEELESNPLLELYENSDSEKSESENDEGNETAQEAADNDYEQLSNESHDYAESSSNIQISGAINNDGESIWERTLSEEKTLREFLQEQIGLLDLNHFEIIIATQLSDLLDENGWVKQEEGASISQIAENLGCDKDLVLSILSRLQSLEPSGIFATNLKECLSIQLKAKQRLDPMMESFLENLDYVATGDFAKIKKICGCTDEDIQGMLKEIRALNPKPGAGFVRDVLQVSVPDLFLKTLPNGDWRVEINAETMPRLLVNGVYYSDIKKKTKDAKEKEYISEQYQRASWLLRALNQRAETMLKVTTEIIKEQEMFFKKGIMHLKPLTLVEIAGRVGMHESTIGRVTTGKIIATPRGNMELRFFFSSSISKEDGEGHSSRSARALIKDFVSKEEAGNVLSDDQLVALLKGQGIEIARRTVAKYRDLLGIPSSVERNRAIKRKGY